MDKNRVLSIAGSDCSGGAGIQADLKTIQAHALYGMSVITSITAQNTTGVYGVYDVTPEYVRKQIEAVMEDIFPDAVKIGMVSNAGIIKEIVKTLKEYNIKNLVVDPVMVSTSGCKLLEKEAEEALVGELANGRHYNTKYSGSGGFKRNIDSDRRRHGDCGKNYF